MIRECNILLNNNLNMVIDFNGHEIQMPTSNPSGNTVFVRFENNRYTLATKEEYNILLKTSTKKQHKLRENKNLEESIGEYK